MQKRGEPVPILMADDDTDDLMMAEKALREARLTNVLRTVKDGEELLDYLHQRGKYADAAKNPMPGLILLDLNMPRISGREALAEIKGDPNFRRIPVVVLTTSKSEEDILRSYDLGGNSFITKPVTFHGLVEALKLINRYWFELVSLPYDSNGG